MFDELRARVGAGDGVVARFPGVVCVAEAGDVEPVRALLGLCAEVAGPEPGRALARKLAAWLAGPDAPPPSLRFGTLADAGDRWAVFLSGAVTLHADGTTIDGADAAAWTDRLITPAAGALVLTLNGADGADGGSLGTLLDLRAGVVAGAGTTLLATAPDLDLATAQEMEPAPGPESFGGLDEATLGADAVAPTPAPPATPGPPRVRPPRRAERIDLAAAPPPRPPLDAGRPLATRSDRPAGKRGGGAATKVAVDRPRATPDGPQAQGHLCSRGHLNDPRSHFCVLCGIRMNERTGVLVIGSRPPLGLLVVDDGATYTVDAEYLLGRAPDTDERVRSGALRSIALDDPRGAISRVHAEVRVRGWDVVIVDSGSRNGTHVAEPGATAWTAVPPGRAHRLAPGTRVRLGSRTFLFESPSGVR
jgi:FHA domain